MDDIRSARFTGKETVSVRGILRRRCIRLYEAIPNLSRAENGNKETREAIEYNRDGACRKLPSTRPPQL